MLQCCCKESLDDEEADTIKLILLNIPVPNQSFPLGGKPSVPLPKSSP